MSVEKFSKGVERWWQPVVYVVGLVFACGMAWSSQANNASRIDAIEQRQLRDEESRDQRLRKVEEGVATLLERTRPK